MGCSVARVGALASMSRTSRPARGGSQPVACGTAVRIMRGPRMPDSSWSARTRTSDRPPARQRVWSAAARRPRPRNCVVTRLVQRVDRRLGFDDVQRIAGGGADLHVRLAVQRQIGRGRAAQSRYPASGPGRDGTRRGYSDTIVDDDLGPQVRQRAASPLGERNSIRDVLALEPSGADTEFDRPPLMASTWVTWMASGGSRNVTGLSKVVCGCTRAVPIATSTGTSSKPSPTTDAEVLPSGCRHNLAQAVVR
jgi:hypothetical protein